ncbi:MAG: hypothetical protein ACI4U2_01060 [Christensenellaceae bacterium]
MRTDDRFERLQLERRLATCAPEEVDSLVRRLYDLERRRFRE